MIPTPKKQQILIIALIALLLMAVMPAQAQNITMSNPDSTMERDVVVYTLNGTGAALYGLYNTTSIIGLDGDSDYIFVLKPQYSNPLDEPLTWLDSAFSYVSTNIIPILIIIFLIGLLFRESRRRS